MQNGGAKMRVLKSLLLTAATLTVTPAFAADLFAPTTTSVGEPAAKNDLAASIRFWGGFGFGVKGYDSDFDGNFGDFGANARVGGERWILEAFTEFNTDIGDDNNTGGGTSGGLAVHLHGENIGVFGGIVGANFYDDEDFSINAFGGLEGIYYAGNSAFFGQIGYQGAVAGVTDDDTWQEGAFARTGWRYYLSDDSKFELDLAGGLGTFDRQDGAYIVGWGATYERRLSGPFSGGLFYRGTYMDLADCDCDKEMDHVFGLSLTVDVNSSSIRERDQMLPFETPGPLFHRGVSWSESVY